MEINLFILTVCQAVFLHELFFKIIKLSINKSNVTCKVRNMCKVAPTEGNYVVVYLSADVLSTPYAFDSAR